MEKALEIEQQTSNDLATDKSVASILHAIGGQQIGINKLSDAKEYLEKALEIDQQTSNDLATKV